MRRRLLTLIIAASMLTAACGGTASTITQGFPSAPVHPTPAEETFQGCPPSGDGGDRQLNLLKNRVDDGITGVYTPVSLSTLLSLTWPSSVNRRSRSDWSPQDAAAVSQYENVAIQTTGYLIAIKHEGEESPNCHSTSSRDFHMWLAPSAKGLKAQSIVVEVTPRVRAMRSGWTDAALAALVGRQIRVSGWTMLDQEHPEQLNVYRATLWEIHPVMHIDVYEGGSWVRIDNG